LIRWIRTCGITEQVQMLRVSGISGFETAFISDPEISCNPRFQIIISFTSIACCNIDAICFDALIVVHIISGAAQQSVGRKSQSIIQSQRIIGFEIIVDIQCRLQRLSSFFNDTVVDGSTEIARSERMMNAIDTKANRIFRIEVKIKILFQIPVLDIGIDVKSVSPFLILI